MSLGFDVRPEPLGWDVLLTTDVDLFVCPLTDLDGNPVKGATVREINVANNDLTGSVRTAHRVWIHKVPTVGPTTAEIPGELVQDGLDFEGVLTLRPGDKITGRADANALVDVTVSGALTVLKP